MNKNVYVIGSIDMYVFGGDTVTYKTPWGKTSLLAPYEGFVFNKEYCYTYGDDIDKFGTPMMFNTRREARQYCKSNGYRSYQVIINEDNKIIKWIKKNP